MAASLPYLASNKNVEALFAKVLSAKVPERFSQDFLKTTIGLKGSNDRALIPLLRALGFVDQTGAPASPYRLLKNAETAKDAIGAGVRRAYAPLFEANESAHALPSDKLKGLVAQVAGTDSEMTARIAATFNALVRLATFGTLDTAKDFDGNNYDADGEAGEYTGTDDLPQAKRTGVKNGSGSRAGRGMLQAGFHYDIHVHLPTNGSEDTYLNIFNALRKSFE